MPSGLQWALEGLAFSIFLVFIGRMSNGDAALAASGIVVTVMMLAVLPALGVACCVGARRTAPGGKRPEKSEVATWSGLQVALMYILLVDLTFVLFPSFYLSWFTIPATRNFGRRFAPSCRTC